MFTRQARDFEICIVPADGSAPIFVGVAGYGFNRPDISGIFGSQFAGSGFGVSGSLPPGTYTIAAFAYSTVAGTFNNVRLAANVVVR